MFTWNRNRSMQSKRVVRSFPKPRMGAENLIETNCGYVVAADTECSGSVNVNPKTCRSCPSFVTSTFYTNWVGVNKQKRAVVKVHEIREVKFT